MGRRRPHVRYAGLFEIPARVRLLEKDPSQIPIYQVTICDGSLNFLLSQCNSLERLDITGMGNRSLIHVRSPCLKVLNCQGHFDELFIQYAPNQERLQYRYMFLNGWQAKGVHLKVEHAPKMEFMGYVSMSLHTIEIGESIFTASLLFIHSWHHHQLIHNQKFFFCFSHWLVQI